MLTSKQPQHAYQYSDFCIWVYLYKGLGNFTANDIYSFVN